MASKCYLRLNKIRIHDSRETVIFGLGGKAEAKIFSFVSDQASSLSGIDALSTEQDLDKRGRDAIKLLKRCVQSFEFVTVDNIKDGAVLMFGDTGFTVGEWKTIPSSINWILWAIDTDKDLRQLGTLLETTVKGDDAKNVAEKLIDLVGGANPAKVYFEVAKFSISLLARILKENKDDTLGIMYVSLIREADYPHALRDRQDVPDLSGNMLVDYSVFGISRS